MKIIMTKGEISAVKGLMDKLGINSSILSFSNLSFSNKYASIKVKGDEVVADINPEYCKDVVDFTTEAAVGIDNLPWDKIVNTIGLRKQLAKAWRYACKAWKELVKADFDSAVDKFLDTPEITTLSDELDKKAKAINQKWGCRL